MNKRELAISIARVAGYHDDKARFTRLVVEARVARKHLDDAWRIGVQQKRNGMPCTCARCAA